MHQLWKLCGRFSQWQSEWKYFWAGGLLCVLIHVLVAMLWSIIFYSRGYFIFFNNLCYILLAWCVFTLVIRYQYMTNAWRRVYPLLLLVPLFISIEWFFSASWVLEHLLYLESGELWQVFLTSGTQYIPFTNDPEEWARVTTARVNVLGIQVMFYSAWGRVLMLAGVVACLSQLYRAKWAKGRMLWFVSTWAIYLVYLVNNHWMDFEHYNQVQEMTIKIDGMELTLWDETSSYIILIKNVLWGVVRDICFIGPILILWAFRSWKNDLPIDRVKKIEIREAID